MKLIKFIPWSKVIKETTPNPVRASVPQWWRDGETTFESLDHGPHDGYDGGAHNGMKTCIPFMEVMTSGYFLLTPFDIYVVKNSDGNTEISFQAPEIVEDNQLDFVNERPAELGSTIPRPKGFLPNGFTWFSYWSWKTPRGYSTFVTHPYNRHELPFITLNAIVDSDKFHLNGNIPFFLKDDFEGIIPAGTPFAQIVPFKRNGWKMWVDDTFNKEMLEEQGKHIRNSDMSYKKRFWVKKEY